MAQEEERSSYRGQDNLRLRSNAQNKDYDSSGDLEFQDNLKMSALSFQQRLKDKKINHFQQNTVQSQSSRQDQKIAQFSDRSSKEQSSQNPIISFQQQTNPSIQILSGKQTRKQPLYSMIPSHVNKNLNSQPYSNSSLSSKQPNSTTAIMKPISNFSSEFINYNNPVGSQTNTTLTPKKQHPIPISPTERPTIINVLHQQPIKINSQVPQERQLRNQNNSGQKQTVVYNEFKYYTSSASSDLGVRRQVSNYSGMMQRKSDASSNNGGVRQQLQFELSPNEHKIFEITSPRFAAQGIRGNSIRQQILYTGSNISSQQDSHKNYQIQLKQDNDEDQDPLDKFRNLQNYVKTLEQDLKQNQEKNFELQKIIKEKAYIQSFERNSKKHLSDTEDSLILSEKKGNRRISNIKGPNSSFQQLQHDSHNQKSTSSIVDVKIKPIQNMKSTSPFNHKKNSNAKVQNSSSKKNSLIEDQRLEYQVQDYSGSQLNISNQNQSQEELEDVHFHEQQQEEEECESCERLKNLVFQAKEAIDDLKQEIEEWRNLCAQKETELRQLQHRIYNDIVGVDKRIEFNEDVQLKEFDTNRPVSTEQKRIRNFIQHNKKRIRSRSKNSQLKQSDSQTSSKKVSVLHSIRKKSALKNLKDIGSEDYEFYEAEDQGIQTSFIIDQHQHSHNEVLSNISIENFSNRQPLKSNQVNSNYYMSNTSTTPELIEVKENQDISAIAFHKINDDNIEEINSLKTRNQIQESEIIKLRQQLELLSKQCEQFNNLVSRTKKKVKKQTTPSIDEIRDHYELISNIESYSILEKINEWKKDEGLLQTQEDGDLPVCQIPRPLKLIMDIDMSEIEVYEQQKKVPTVQYDITKGNIQEYMGVIKQEQENLKKQQENKYKELQKQQQEYLNLLKGI